MSSEAEKAVVRSNTEAVQSQGDFDLFEALFADDVLDHTPQPNMTPDKPGVRGLYKAMREAFPDFHAVIHWQTADGEIVTTFTTSHGTHQGTFLGVAPTGRKVHVETVDAMRVHDGKITEHGGVANLCSCMQQLSGSNPDTTKEIPMTTQRTTTADAMTTLKLTPKFDVTYLPRKIEALLAETEKPLHR